MTQPAPYWAAIWLACFLHICHQHSDKIGMATHPGPVNMEHELVLVEGDKAIATPSYHAFRMLREHAGCMRVETKSENVPMCDRLGSESVLVSASLDDSQKRVVITVVNLDLERSITCRLAIAGSKVLSAKSEVLASEDRNAANSFADPFCITPSVGQLSWAAGNPVLALPACSVTNLIAALA